MNLRIKKPPFPIFFLLFILFLVFACSPPSWFPIKKGPTYKAKKKELLDKEVVIIDREEYVKVINPKVSEEEKQPKYLYIPIDEYLSKRNTFILPATRSEETKKEFLSSTKSLTSQPDKEISPISSSKSSSSPLNLKKK